MKHLRLLGMESEREALLKAMQDMECVEISSIDGSEEALKSGFAKPDDKALMSAQEASRAYRTALASLDRFAPEKKGMLRKRQGVSRAAFSAPRARKMPAPRRRRSTRTHAASAKSRASARKMRRCERLLPRG